MKIPPFTCPHCNKTVDSFPMAGIFKAGLKGLLYSCPHCGGKFPYTQMAKLQAAGVVHQNTAAPDKTTAAVSTAPVTGHDGPAFQCPECSQVFGNGTVRWGYRGPCPKCKKWVDVWIEINQATGEPVRSAAEAPATPSETTPAASADTPPYFKTEYPTVAQAQEAIAQIKAGYPVSTPAYVPDGKTTPQALAAMILGAPVAWVAAAVCAALAGGLAGLLVGVAGKMLLWFPSKIGFLRDFTNDYLDPLLLFIVKFVVVCVGGYVTAVMVSKIVSAFGRLGKNRSVVAAQLISTVATALLLGFTWFTNLQHNPMFPNILQGGWGIAVGILFALGFAGLGAEQAENAIKDHPFCPQCQQFTFVPRVLGVSASCLAAIRSAVQSGFLQPLSLFPANPKEVLGTVTWHECLGCGAGYLNLTVELATKCGSEPSTMRLQDRWLTASAHLAGDGAKNAKALFPPLPTAKNTAKTDPSQLRCPACGTLYRPEDYDQSATKIYCASCRAELPKST